MPSSAHLGQHLEDYVSELVKTGRYGSRSEVLREGVRLIEEREKRLAVLDAAIMRGLADLEAGRVTTSQQVRDELVAKYRALAAASK
jgi:antitoxin ParD1/3/4